MNKIYSTQGISIFPGYEIRIACEPRERFENHEVLDRFCLALITSGSGIVHISGKSIPFIAPSVFCINHKESVNIKNNCIYEALSVYFHPDVINKDLNFKNIYELSSLSPERLNDSYWLLPFTDRSDKYNGIIPVGPNSISTLTHFYEELNRELVGQKDSFWPCRSRTIFLEMLIFLSKVYMKGNDSEVYGINTDDEDVSALIRYINENYHEKITINEITERLCTNRTTISKKFSDASGMSIIDYLTRVRIHMSCVMLRDTSLPVSEILYRVGFNDPTHFSRSFKKILGHTPSEYREKYCWLAK